MCEIVAEEVYINQNVQVRNYLDSFMTILNMADTTICTPQIYLFFLPYLEYLVVAYGG